MTNCISADKKSLISILMGVYNCADTLQHAVESIISQNYAD